MMRATAAPARSLRAITASVRNVRSYGHAKVPTIDGQMPMMINNEFVKSSATEFCDIINPATQEHLSHVPLCTTAELKAAAASCQEAFPAWRLARPRRPMRPPELAPDGVTGRDTSVSNRARVMLKWQQLLRHHKSLPSAAAHGSSSSPFPHPKRRLQGEHGRARRGHHRGARQDHRGRQR